MHLNFIFLLRCFSDEPEIVYPSAGTAYPTKKTFLRNDDDIEEFVSHFGMIDHEVLLVGSKTEFYSQEFCSDSQFGTKIRMNISQ